MTKTVFIILIGIVVAAAGWYFLSPLFITTVVDEDFPAADMTEADRELMAKALEGTGMELPALEELQNMTQSEMDKLEKQVIEASDRMPDTLMDEPLESAGEPILLLSGEFQDADGFHKGSGAVGIYELADGSRIARFENFTVTNGPDLRVLLARHPSPDNSADVQNGYRELGRLKGTVGNQNYEISDDIDLSEYSSIVIYCKPFHVVFSTAALK